MVLLARLGLRARRLLTALATYVVDDATHPRWFAGVTESGGRRRGNGP